MKQLRTKRWDYLAEDKDKGTEGTDFVRCKYCGYCINKNLVRKDNHEIVSPQYEGCPKCGSPNFE